MNIFKNVTYVSKKTRKTKEEIKKDLEEWIINGEKNENKDIEERKCEDAVTVVEWLKNLRIFFKKEEKTSSDDHTNKKKFQNFKRREKNFSLMKEIGTNT